MSNNTLYDIRADGKSRAMVHIRAVGGSTAITEVEGPGVAISRTGTGAYRLTFSDAYPALISAHAQLQAATPGDLAGHTVIFDTLSSKVMDFVVYNASDAAHDLAASEWVMITCFFRDTSVTT